LLNYSSHAITDLLPTMTEALRDLRSRDAEQILAFIDGVRRAEKFVLPDHGSLVYDMEQVPDGIEITRLPFPLTVMEVPFSWDHGGSTTVIASSKRLILAREGIFVRKGTPFRTVRDSETPNAVKIDVACWIDRDRTWILQPVGAILMIGWKSYGKGAVNDDARGDLFRDAAMFRMMTEPTLDDTVDIVCEKISYEQFIEQCGDDLSSEIRMLAEMMTVLSCSNVGTETARPPEKLQKARAKSGREPFYDVHMLTVNGENLAYAPSAARGEDVDGFRVRQHVRRGHVRRLADGRKIWVNRTVVAAGSKHGVAEKIYRVTP
jgi:hypothetical protein